MTFFRAVISWLAFLYLAWRGVMLSGAWILDRSGIHPTPTPGGLLTPLGMPGPNVTEALLGASVWGPVALALIAPWVWPLIRWLTRQPPPGISHPVTLRLNLAGRWAFALLGAVVLMDLMPRPFEAFLTHNPDVLTEPAGGFFTSIFKNAFIGILCAVMIAPEIALIASSGFTSFIDSVFFPGGREKKPPYTLKLARFYVQKRRWEDAEAEYARMRSFYPDRLEAWQESLRVAFAMGDDADPQPDKILSKGLKKLKAPEEKEALFATFNAREKPVIAPEPEDF